MKNIKPPIFFWITLSASLLLVSASCVYYLVVYLPYQGRLKQDLENTKFEQSLTDKEHEAELRKDCIDELKDYFKDKPNYTLENANAVYRRCLAENGMEPENLVE